ncbi:hypothetical protein SI65_01394 [Aspergillus cristatus]|uniref:RNase H type-1 domain-containing protein n=1 Tax=Aspergillus cristatus TaxID=573508 RepID=A0A1E3BSA1_ASPCR|nr:hypothetical protein SI65_01394 [Aspergillus cristatus]
MELLLNQRRRSLEVRVQQLDAQHPLHLHAMHQKSGHIKTRFLRAIDPANVHLVEQIDPLLTSPWDSNPEPKDRPIAIPKIQSKEAFQKWLESIPPLSMVVYTDGSKEKEDTAAGAGWVGYWDISKTKIFRGHRKLPNHEVFDAEAQAALLGLQAALKDSKAQHSTNIYICLDNLEAVQQLQGQPKGSSQSIFMNFQEAAQTWPQHPRAPGIQSGSVQVKWVPGHTGIEGNEGA